MRGLDEFIVFFYIVFFCQVKKKTSGTEVRTKPCLLTETVLAGDVLPISVAWSSNGYRYWLGSPAPLNYPGRRKVTSGWARLFVVCRLLVCNSYQPTARTMDRSDSLPAFVSPLSVSESNKQTNKQRKSNRFHFLHMHFIYSPGDLNQTVYRIG